MLKAVKNKLILLVAVMLCVYACSQDAGTDLNDTGSAPIPGRWYYPAQVRQGGPLYQQHCSSCHGDRAQATPNWRIRDSNGHYPPPPLNGSAHTWHHSLAVLRKTIRTGGIRLGGQMPAFGEQLNNQEIDAILAWLQSQWPEQIYQAWLPRSGIF